MQVLQLSIRSGAQTEFGLTMLVVGRPFENMIPVPSTATILVLNLILGQGSGAMCAPDSSLVAQME